MYRFMLAPRGLVPIGEQLKEQIRWAIATGDLKPGCSLPSVRDLSDTLGVARNTINAVYDELRDEGLIQMGRGKGTEVTESESGRRLARLAPLLQLLDDAHQRALAEGYSVEEVTRAALVRAQLLEVQARAPECLTLVDAPGHEPEWFAQQIRAVTGRPVRIVSLELLAANPTLAGSPVITSCMGAGKVRPLLPAGTEIIFLGLGLPMRIVVQMMALPAGASVLFVGRTPQVVAAVAKAAREGGADHVALEALGMDEPDLLERCNAAQNVYAMPSVHQELAEIVTNQNTVRLLDVALETASVEALKGLAGRPS